MILLRCAAVVSCVWNAPLANISAQNATEESGLASASSSTQVQTEYREVVERAVSEYDHGYAMEARALFLRAHELWPSARTLRTLGMTAFELRMYTQALDELQRALADTRRPLDDAQRMQVLELIRETRGFVGQYHVASLPEGSELLIDGASTSVSPTIVLSLGEHQLIVRTRGYHELRRTLHVEGAEDEDLSLVLDPVVAAPAPRVVTMVTKLALDRAAVAKPELNKPERAPTIAHWVLLGGAAGSVIAGGVFVTLALVDKHKVEAANGQTLAELQRAHNSVPIYSALGAVMLGVGVVGGAASLGFMFWGHDDSAPAASLQVGVNGLQYRGVW